MWDLMRRVIVPRGAVQAIAVTPSRHLSIEFGSKNVRQCDPCYLVPNRSLEILPKPGSPFVIGLLRLRHELKRSANPAAQLEVASNTFEFGF
jgi:hypothetical protein